MKLKALKTLQIGGNSEKTHQKIAYNQMLEVATTCSVENSMTVDAKNSLS
jgi:hypothetical protein